ncbi:MAG: enoyl-CoA hydratase [Acidimicrobiia bacterium]
MADDVLYDLRDGVATLTLNRPDRLNAQTTSMFEQALELLEHCAHDDAVRVVVLTGAGRGFCAGGDLSQMADQSGPPKPLPTRVRELRHLTHTSQLLHEMPKVTIAAINGPCAGGGMSWAMACDLRYAARSATLTTAFVHAALSGDFGMTWFLPRVAGSARARELLFFGDRLRADEAAELGLVNAVFDDDALLDEVNRRAAELVGRPPLALAGLKANVNDAERLDLAHHLDVESDRLVRIFGSRDTREAAQAFFEKRPPRFTGR